MTISIEIEEIDGSTVLAQVDTPRGALILLGEVHVADRHLVVADLHVQGLTRGSLRRTGLNAVCRAIMDATDVDTITIFGSVRSTGRRSGYRPRRIVFRR